MKENEVQAAAIKFATAVGVHHIRLVFRNGVAAGWPDTCFLIPGGRPLWIEFKRPGDVLDAIQIYRCDLLREIGYDVAVCDTFEKAQQALLMALSRAGKPAAKVYALALREVARLRSGPVSQWKNKQST